MIFETLHESATANELILIDGGYCRWHRRRDGVIVIYEIISTRPGAGTLMLTILKTRGVPIVAKCPADLAANAWYARRGFTRIAIETTRSGRTINVWRLDGDAAE